MLWMFCCDRRKRRRPRESRTDMKLLKTWPWVLGLLLLATSPATSAQDKATSIGPLKAAGASASLVQAVGEKGYRITLTGGWTADFWFTKQLKTVAKDAPGAVYPELSNGEFVGVVDLTRGITDYRGQNITPGIYTLRYQTIPQDGNHMGVAPNPDFLLLIPVASDPDPAVVLLYKKLVTLSSKTTGTSHPGVLALEVPGDPGTVEKDPQGTVTFSVAVAASGISPSERLTLVLKGQPPQ